MPFLQFKTSVAKTASYSLLKTDHDKWFTNTGAAGAVVFTLPAIADVNDGWLTDFFVTADQNLTNADLARHATIDIAPWAN